MTLTFQVQFTTLIDGRGIETVETAYDVVFTHGMWLDKSTLKFKMLIRDLPEIENNFFFLNYRIGAYNFGVRIIDSNGNVPWYGYVDSVTIQEDRQTIEISCNGMTELIKNNPIIANDYPNGAALRVNPSGGDTMQRVATFTGATVKDLVSALSTRYADFNNLFGRYQTGNIKYQVNQLELPTVGDAINDVRERYPNTLLRLKAAASGDDTLVYWDTIKYNKMTLYESDNEVVRVKDVTFMPGYPRGIVASFKSAANKEYAYFYTHLPAREGVEIRSPITWRMSGTPQTPEAFKQTCQYIADTRRGGSFTLDLRLNINTLNLVDTTGVVTVYTQIGDGVLALCGTIGSYEVRIHDDIISVKVENVTTSNSVDDIMTPQVNLISNQLGAAILRNTKNVNSLSSPIR